MLTVATNDDDSDGSNEVHVYTFKNSLADNLSVLAYGPRHGSSVDEPILRWFAGSDDYSNLTFDVYLGSNSNPTTLVANDITNLSYKPTSFENQTLYYWKIVATDPSGSKTSSIMNFTYLNTAPTATITSISPQIVFRNSTVTFNGTGSDFDGNVTGYEWKSSIEGVLSYSANSTASELSIGNHTIYFRVQDDEYSWSDPAVSWVNVLSTSPVATIVSITPNPVNYESTATFVGSASDPDGEVSAYRWSSSIDGTLSNSLNFTTDDLSLGNHTIYFKVKDDAGQWSTEVSSWIRVNAYPVISTSSISPHTIYKNDLNGTTIYFNSSVSDSDGSVTHYYWNSSKDGNLATSGSFTTSVNTLSLGNHTITLRIRDNDGAWVSTTSYLVVKSYPNATINSISHTVAHEDASVTFNGSGSDSDGTITGYHWSSSLDGTLSSSAVFSTADLSVGNHTIYLKVKDNDTLWSTAATSWVRINAYPVFFQLHFKFKFCFTYLYFCNIYPSYRYRRQQWYINRCSTI